MAKATVECTCPKCGRTYTKTKICYNRSEAESWEAWMREYYDGLCSDCYAEQRKAEEAAKTDAANAGLPELTGSEKQVAWAKKIRAGLVELFKRSLNPCYDPVATVANLPTDARWWIENRYDIDDLPIIENDTETLREIKAALVKKEEDKQ